MKSLRIFQLAKEQGKSALTLIIEQVNKPCLTVKQLITVVNHNIYGIKFRREDIIREFEKQKTIINP